MKPRGGGAWESSRRPPECWISAASSGDPIGPQCVQVRAPLQPPSQNLVIGSMAGNTTRLPFSNTTSGTVVFAQSSAANQAHLRSHSGPGSSAVLCGAPTGQEFSLQPSVFRIAILERLRLPLETIEAQLCAGVGLTVLGDIEAYVLDQVCCAPGPQHQRGFAERLELWFG